MTPTKYFLRPETRHRPHQSSQYIYNAFPSKARYQCFTLYSQNERKHDNIYIGTRQTLSIVRLIPSRKLCCRRPERYLEKRARSSVNTAGQVYFRQKLFIFPRCSMPLKDCGIFNSSSTVTVSPLGRENA